MGRLLSKNGELNTQGKAVLAALLLLIGWLIPLWAALPVRAEETDTQVLLESGIRYPEGFDSNTVGTVEGKISNYMKPEKGPVRFQVKTQRESYTVLACPPWYWNDLGGETVEGTQVRVRGSKSLGKDGNLYIIAQEIQILPSGKFLLFRSEDGHPLWKGPRHGTMRRHRGPGMSQPGRGGMGGGAGRMHRGGR